MARLILLAICGTFLGAAKAQFALDPPSSYLDTLHAERSIMEFLGSKTPFSSHSDMFSLAEIPEQCRLVCTARRPPSLSWPDDLHTRRCI